MFMKQACDVGFSVMVWGGLPLHQMPSCVSTSKRIVDMTRLLTKWHTSHSCPLVDLYFFSLMERMFYIFDCGT